MYEPVQYYMLEPHLASNGQQYLYVLSTVPGTIRTDIGGLTEMQQFSQNWQKTVEWCQLLQDTLCRYSTVV